MKTGSSNIYKPNRLIGARSDGFGPLHLRSFVAIPIQFQPFVLAHTNGTGIAQEIGYKDNIEDCTHVAIPLKDITTPNHHPQAIKAACDLLSLAINIMLKTAPDNHALGRLFGETADLDVLAVKAIHPVGKRTDENKQPIADRVAYLSPDSCSRHCPLLSG